MSLTGCGLLLPAAGSFDAIRGNLTLIGDGKGGAAPTAVFIGLDGEGCCAYADELQLNGKSLGPVIYHYQFGIFRQPLL